MAGVPFPNLTLAAPAQSSATTPFSTPFAVGGASAGGIPPLFWYAVLGLGAIYLYKRL